MCYFEFSFQSTFNLLSFLQNIVAIFFSSVLFQIVCHLVGLLIWCIRLKSVNYIGSVIIHVCVCMLNGGSLWSVQVIYATASILNWFMFYRCHADIALNYFYNIQVRVAPKAITFDVLFLLWHAPIKMNIYMSETYKWRERERERCHI